MAPRMPFEEKTNTGNARTEKSAKDRCGEKERIANFLRMAKAETRDHSLRYDLELCIEIIEGKENQQITELRDAIGELAAENEELTKKCDSLEMQLLRLH